MAKKNLSDKLKIAILMAAVLPMAFALPASAQVAPPGFSKVFMPDAIGPESTSMLVFTIDNSDNPGDAVGDLAFTDTLPAEIKLAAPAFVSNGCAGTLTAPDGGSTIALLDGMVGAGLSCEIVVNVTAEAVDGSDTTHTNTSGDLTSSAGNSGTAEADLMVDIDLPGFSKSFAPSTVEFGGRSTLTFTIDNSLNDVPVDSMSFVDTLPAGMVVADPAFPSTDCETAPVAATLVAIPGTGVISYSYVGIVTIPAVAATETCTVTVDVIGGAIGQLGNVSTDLVVRSGFEDLLIGKAAAVLEVTGFEDLLELSKEFIDDPVAPGGTTTLEFTVTNKSRSDTATAITFDDDLESTLTGLTPTLPPTPDPPCGAGSSLSFSLGVLTLAGGTLPPEGSCTFSVELAVPGGAPPGTYPNTAGPVSGDVGGSPETGNVAGDLLFVVSSPILTKEFTDDPVAAGDTVTLEFTITNPESTSTMSDIEFIDELTDNSGALVGGAVGNGFLPFPVSVGLPPTPDPPCGLGSSLALVSVGDDRQGLELTGGSLAAAGGPGDSCTFSVTVDIPLGLPGGTYVNTTEEISAVLDDFPGPPTVVGPPASDTIVVASTPTLTKEFTDDPVSPSGGPVTLEFTLLYDPELPAPDATAIAFIDDLTALVPAVPGLVAASVDTNTCAGATVDISTPTLIDFSGGTLTPGTSCVVSLTLTVPAAAPVGFHNNTTSDVTATVGGVAASNNGAEDDLLITALVFTKEFIDDPVVAGGTANLRFTLDNVGSTDATSISFLDALSAILPGTPDVTVVSFPSTPCGGTLSSVIPTFLSFSGGAVQSGDPPCSFDVTVLVPAGAADGSYINTTSSLTSSLGTSPPAVDALVIDSELIEIAKEFTDDPVQPEKPVTLEFTLTNLSATQSITDIAFDDDLDATLAGLQASSVDSNDCNATVDISTPTLIKVTGGSLGLGGNCTISLTLDVPPAPLPGSVFSNSTTGVTGKVGTLDVFGSPASDELKVQLLTFSKAFDGSTTANGTAVLSFTITNQDSTTANGDLAFSDDLGAVITGLEATLPPTPDPPCGAGSALAGTSFLTLTGGTLAAAGSPGDNCTFAVTVTVPSSASDGSFPNTTSDLFQFGIPVADPTTALLTIEPPPLFSKSFAPASIGAGFTSTLTFTIDNTASAFAATDLDFTDTLPAGMEVATPPNTATTCGGTLTAMSDAMLISLTGGTVGAGATCTIEVDVAGVAVGVHVNTTGDLTSSSGNSGPASDTLTVLDATPPQVTAVATSAGPLAECDTAQMEISRLFVTFSESVQDPPGDTDPDDVTNPVNYLVIAAGPDADFSSAACGTVFGDDVPVPILGVSYDDGSATASLDLSTPLPSSQIRLIVCGSTSIYDLAGNPLDGNGNGTGGDDFVLTFRSDPFNLLTNGHFDCDENGWVLTSATPGEIFHSPTDSDNSAASGSLEFMQLGINTMFSAEQCVQTSSGTKTDLTGLAQVAAGGGVQLSLTAGCTSFASTDCSDPSLGTSSTTAIFGDSGGSWQPIALTVIEQPGRQSILCSFMLSVPNGDNFSLRLDQAVLGASSAIFADDFESGDTSAWSTTVGGSP